MNLSKNWQLVLLGIMVLLSLGAIFVYGIKLGMDFRGGTLYQIELAGKLSPEEISRISNIIAQRVDPSGLKDATVYPVGGQFVVAQLSETNPVELEKIESRIRKQGKFEANLNGENVFTGDEIKKVLRGDSTYGVFRAGTDVYEWRLPFVLNEDATKSFTQKTFHQCAETGFGANGLANYQCEKTTFFLDKPDAVIVMTSEQYNSDSDLLTAGNKLENIPQGTGIDELIEDSMLKVIVLDENKPIDANAAAQALKSTHDAVVSPDVPASTIHDLNSFGFNVTITQKKEGIPWIWTATNARQIISLTSGITNEDVSDISQAKEFSTLLISGQRDKLNDARQDLDELAILLESGSLPTPVKSISKETVSPSLGESFLSNVILMGIVAGIMVALVLIVRYRTLKLAIPIFITGISEIIIMMGFLAITQRPLDLAAFAGLIAAIGTGVDAEVVITDEVLRKAAATHESLVQRAKNALFIVATSAFTVIAVMGPIVFFARNLPGLDKLFGFAVVTITGALIGILITRPAFNRIIQSITVGEEHKHHAEHESKNG